VTEDEEKVAAVRALLAEPLIDRTNPEALALVRRHRAWLMRWFADELNYRLDASHPEVVRLAKMPGPGHVPRGLRTRRGKRFDSRRYAVACLVLASAEAAGERCTLAQMFDDVAARAAGIEGLAFDPDVGADRRVFIQAVQAIADLGVLEKAEGDEERFARGSEGGDALYRIDRDRLVMLPTAPQPPSLMASWREVGYEPYPDTETGRARRRRHRVTRALVEQPIVYQSDLTPDEHDYLRSQRGRLERLLIDQVGLTLEVRAEGWVGVDESGDLTDLRWPDYGAAETTALRLCDELRGRRGRGAAASWPWLEVVAFVQALAVEYEGYWKKDAASSSVALDLAERAVSILVAARLVRSGDDGVTALPAAGRFAAAAAILPPPNLQQQELL
jgi:uncharacterized protein (TIGR02678 family)